jgi:hypothetical protein
VTTNLSRVDRLIPRFVEFVPPQLEDGVLYISVPYDTAVHRCCCGCGGKVVTPLAPTEWRLIKHGDAVSLRPSVGNWSFPCQSHYWVSNNRIEWAGQWSQDQIDAGRRADRKLKATYFSTGTAESDPLINKGEPPPAKWWQRLWARLFGLR